MKMVKSLLLSGAAGLVATAGAQAADLPVKAKPVEYVKVCSLYGAGFYYIPGTDICLKIGGYVRYQVNVGSGSSISFGPFNGVGGYNNRIVNGDVAQRVRAIATWDTRQQTAYGTLRTYLLMGYTQDTNSGAAPGGAAAPYLTRGFIQIAGFTFGKATSYFDFVSTAAVAYNAGFTHAPDTGDAGQIVGAYTAQLGNGVSATLAIEQSKRLSTTYVGAPGSAVSVVPYSFGLVATPAAFNLGGQGLATIDSYPDIVGNIRIDQAWGSAQVSAAAHDVSASYYGAAVAGGVPTGAFEVNGHPSNKWGWAVSPGLRLNAPMFGPGDYFQIAAVYARGATRYASNSPSGATNRYHEGNSFAIGFYEDAIFSGTSGGAGLANSIGNGLNLTTAWSMFASYEHFWTPALRTSLYGSLIDISRNGSANYAICSSLSVNLGTAGATAGCNMNHRVWNIGSRSQWNITKDFYVGVDVIYQKFETGQFNGNAPFATGGGTALAAGGGFYTGTYQTADKEAVSVTWRVHRDIVP